MKKSGFSVLLLLFITGLALAQIYKWTDEKGETHFGDHPPEDDGAVKLTFPEGPSQAEIKEAQAELQKTLDARQIHDQREAKERRETESEAMREAAAAGERFQQCVAATYQLQVLEQKRRVYRLRPDSTRLYLENKNRPLEIERLQGLADEYCGTEPAARKQQLAGVFELWDALHPGCVAMGQEISEMQKLKTDGQNDKLTQRVARFERECPDIAPGELWIRDWLLVRKRR